MAVFSSRYRARDAIPGQLGGSYRLGIGGLAFTLHRLTGLGLVVFVLLHILTFTTIPSDPAGYDLALRRMQHWDFKLGEVLLLAALLFHAFNGVRLLLLDHVLPRTRPHRVLFWLVVILTLLAVAGSLTPLLRHWYVHPFFAERLPGAVP